MQRMKNHLRIKTPKTYYMLKIPARILIVYASLMVFMASCITDPPAIPFTVANTQGTYKIRQWYAVDSITHNFYMLYDSLPLCQKAVLIKFDGAGTYSHIHND